MSTKSLTSMCTITTGKLDSNAATKDGKYPFFTCAPEPLRIDNYAYDGDVILLAGNNAQGNFHINRYKGKFNAYQRTYIISANNGYDIDYIKYALELSLRHFKKMAQGSQTKFLTMPILESFQVEDLAYAEQCKKIDFIKLVDKKITSNLKLIQKYENMAKTMFDYWFVQYGDGDLISPAKMHWNDEVQRKIPDGWKVSNLYEIADYVNGLACQKYRPADGENGIPVIKIKEMHEGITDDTEEVSENIPNKYKIENGDILFSWSATLEVMYWTGGYGGLNQHIFKVIPKEGYPKEYVYHQLVSYIINFIKIAESRKTTMGHITSDHMSQSRIVIPPRDMLNKFQDKIKPIHDGLLHCQEENQKLQKLRDWLLPLVMMNKLD